MACGQKMVLPVRIELTTSALPRMRSTTELRQHFRGRRAYDGAARDLSTRVEARPRGRHLAGMTGKDKEREERLAAALRENLRRRKAQSRQIDAGEKKEKPDD
jgi:hypothetical protein